MDSISKREIWLCDPPRGLISRAFSLKDLPKVREVAELCFSKRWSEADYRYFLGSECARSYGLFEGGALVAYVLSLVAQGDLDLVSIGTQPTHQRKRLATWCLRSMEKMVDVQRVFLEVDETNTAAIELYKRTGFSEYGKRKRYYEGLRDAILMRRTLSHAST